MGDREFIGEQWFKFLNSENIPFYLRVKSDADTTNGGGKSVAISWLFYHLKRGEQLQVKGRRKVYGHKLYIWGAKSPTSGELMIVATNQPHENAIDHYLCRWQIETLFGCLKSKGFNFEEVRIIKRNRVKKMVAVLAIAYTWAIIVGQWHHKYEKTIKLKNTEGLKKVSLVMDLNFCA